MVGGTPCHDNVFKKIKLPQVHICRAIIKFKLLILKQNDFLSSYHQVDHWVTFDTVQMYNKLLSKY